MILICQYCYFRTGNQTCLIIDGFPIYINQVSDRWRCWIEKLMVGDGTCVRFVLCVVSNLYNWRQEEYVTYDVVGWCPNAYVDMLMCDWCVLL